MHIIYFGCIATDLLIFYKQTTLCYHGYYVSEGYPSKCIAMCSWLLLGIDEQNPGYLNCLWLFDIKF